MRSWSTSTVGPRRGVRWPCSSGATPRLGRCRSSSRVGRRTRSRAFATSCRMRRMCRGRAWPAASSGRSRSRSRSCPARWTRTRRPSSSPSSGSATGRRCSCWGRRTGSARPCGGPSSWRRAPRSSCMLFSRERRRPRAGLRRGEERAIAHGRDDLDLLAEEGLGRGVGPRPAGGAPLRNGPGPRRLQGRRDRHNVVRPPLLPQEAITVQTPQSGAWHRPRVVVTWPFRGNAAPSRALAKEPCPRSPVSGARRRTCPWVPVASIRLMADAASLDERLEQIGTQLDWVRDYL